jgi:hypothetical protein
MTLARSRMSGAAAAGLALAALLVAAAAPALATTANPAPGAPGASTSRKLPLPKRAPLATISLKCGKSVYTISVPGGQCEHVGSGATGGIGCFNNTGGTSSASCKFGCGDSTSGGTCDKK